MRNIVTTVLICKYFSIFDYQYYFGQFLSSNIHNGKYKFRDDVPLYDNRKAYEENI